MSSRIAPGTPSEPHCECAKKGFTGCMTPDPEQKRLIERAYQVAEACGLPLWCQDEAGPSATRPQPGASWPPQGKARLQPHKYVRKRGTKLITLFRPAARGGAGERRPFGHPCCFTCGCKPFSLSEPGMSQTNFCGALARSRCTLCSADETIESNPQTVRTLLHQFLSMVRERKHQQLRPWMEEALKSGIPELKSFVTGIERVGV